MHLLNLCISCTECCNSSATSLSDVQFEKTENRHYEITFILILRYFRFTTQYTCLKEVYNYGDYVTARHYEMQLFLRFVLYAASALKIKSNC